MVMVAGVPLECPDPAAADIGQAKGQTITKSTEIPTATTPEGAEKQEAATDTVHEMVKPSIDRTSKLEERYLLKTFRDWATFLVQLALILIVIACFHYRDHVFVQPKCDPAAQLEGLAKLGTGFQQELFGQHIAVDGVLRALFAHLTDTDPKKALVLCFHGWLGSGKTHTAHLIAKHLYHDMDSHCDPYVKSFVGPKHFLLDATKLQENQAKLVEIVENTVRGYGRSLFIFDEVDKMPPEIFDVLLPYMDYHNSIDGVDYRKAIFIFLSNTGGAKINEKLLQSMNSENKKREEVTLYDFRDIVSNGAFTEKGGLFKGEMISRKLVDHYIPFLPMEKKHVIQCAKKEIQRRNVLYITPDKVADRVSYQKHGKYGHETVWIAEDGCKNVATHTAYFVHDAVDSFNNVKPEL